MINILAAMYRTFLLLLAVDANLDDEQCIPQTYDSFAYSSDNVCQNVPSKSHGSGFDTQGGGISTDSNKLGGSGRACVPGSADTNCGPTVHDNGSIRTNVKQPPMPQIVPQAPVARQIIIQHQTPQAVQQVVPQAVPQVAPQAIPQAVPQVAPQAIPQTSPMIQQQVPVMQQQQVPLQQYGQPQHMKLIPQPNIQQQFPQYQIPSGYNLRPSIVDPSFCSHLGMQNGLECNGKSLSRVLVENPKAKMQLMSILDYNGMQPPWDYVFDFETERKHKLPDPANLKKKVNQLFVVFDKLRDTIIESLIIVEKYIYRGKNYLREDLKDLHRYRYMLHHVLNRLCGNPSPEIRNELFKRFGAIKEKVACIEGSFKTIKEWLKQMIKSFSKM